MIFKELAKKEFKARQARGELERVGSIVLIGLAFYFDGAEVAALVGLCLVTYILNEINATLRYANFLKEHEVGLHERLDNGA